MSFFGNLFKSSEERAVEEMFEKIAAVLESEQRQNERMPAELFNMMRCGGSVDENDNAVGDFGHELSNPIPVNGPVGELIYLSRLVLPDGQKVFFHRLGSFKGIDIFEIVSANGKFWDILFLDMYHLRKSKKIPKGYAWQNQILTIRGVMHYVDSFPQALFEHIMQELKVIGLYPAGDTDAKRIVIATPPIEHTILVSEVLDNIEGQTTVN